jgi:hypothetical protein
MEIGLQALEWLLKRTDLQAQRSNQPPMFTSYRSFGGPSATQHYLIMSRKGRAGCSMTEPNRSQLPRALFQPIIFCVDITPDSQIRLQATSTQRFYSVGVQECLSLSGTDPKEQVWTIEF